MDTNLIVYCRFCRYIGRERVIVPARNPHVGKTIRYCARCHSLNIRKATAQELETPAQAARLVLYPRFVFLRGGS